ncbi:sodium channel protein Nach-like [Epargyreus clarus]|uniref:sodium channel protein Nach-like n=1 Tax=Epargyreus clarus TaxID=520877 RepID=UPI003C2B9905
MQQKRAWWYNYRARKREPRTKMSIEIIARTAFGTTLKEYADNCSVAGVRQMCDATITHKQRAIYIIMFCVMCATVFYFLRHIWCNSLIKPLVVTMESVTYPISKIDFPAIALCNINRISKKALTAAVKRSSLYLSLKNESRLKEVEWFYLQAGRLLDFTYNPMLRNHPFLYVVPTHVHDTLKLIDLMKNVAPKCEDMLLRCTWAGEEVDCNTLFSVRRTVHGHCCAFNYVLGYDSAGTPNETIATIKRQTEPGQHNGLNVILDPMMDDYAYPMYNIEGIEVLIFDPTHFADPSGGRVIQRNVQPGQAVYFELQSIKQVATREVRKYPYSTRKCLFHDESKKKFSWMYSYSACIVNCRIRTVQSLCKCTPYFLPTERKGSICTLNDLRCLNKHKEKLFYIYPLGAENTDGLETEIQDSLYCPDCLPDCELTQHYTKYSKIPLASDAWEHKLFKSFFLKNLNMTKKCVLSIYQSATDGVLNRLDVVSYWFEILSNVGGLCGVLLGISIITLFEIIYFFSIRFPAKAFQYVNE